jgi:hypothetical protein
MISQIRRLAVACAAACVVAAVAGEGLAQPIDPAARITARKLGADAIALFDKGEYAAALEKFDLANQLVPSPTLGLRAARCLVKLGRLVEASERYTEVTRMKLDASAQNVQRKAQVEALQEREALTPRIPILEVVLEGPQGKGVTVALDGKALPPALLGQKQPIDPGKHVLEAQRADTTVKREVELAEGEEARLALKLPPLPAPPPPPPPPPSPIAMYGWIGVGVGAAGIVVGVANGVAAIAQQGSLLDRCPDRRCPPEAHGDADLYDITRTISTIGFIAGGVIAAGGVTLLLVAPDERRAPLPASKEAANRPYAVAFVSFGGAGVRGFF